jgi:NAD(P)H-hydrate epimerase
LDRIAIEERGIPGFELMQRAGRAAFAELLDRWPSAKCISVCCGKGNNAGDGYIVAGLALELGLAVQVIPIGDSGELTGDAARARDWARSLGLQAVDGPDAVLSGEVIVDGLLGTGISGALRPAYAKVVAAINAAGRGVLSLDIPSGVAADSGGVASDAVRADVTVTFIGRKLGLFTGPGVSLAGEVIYASLSVPSDIAHAVPGCPLLRYAEQEPLPPRDRNAYKQSQGHVVIVGGDRDMGGAPLMAGEAALRMGAGLVTLITREEHRPAVLARRPEIMVVGADSDSAREQALARATVLAVGPGLGRGDWGLGLLREALALGKPAVLDADALHGLVALSPQAGESPLVASPVIVTPHPGEAAVLLGSTTAAVQADRPAAACALAQRVGGVAVLKGAGSVVAHHENGLRGVCAHGNPGMASAGMGDVLSGVIAGLLAQGADLGHAAALGTCLHSAAADLAVEHIGQRSLLATDLLQPMIELLRGSQ